jgi:phosphatidylethanolamine-binding protein (PEBP) family uncharacterized protein
MDLNTNTGAVPIGGLSELNVKFFPNSLLSASHFGNNLTVEQTASEPKVDWTKPVDGTLRTFLCWDPDIHGANGVAEPNNGYLHWLVINCKGADPSTGVTITPWKRPSPPNKQKHRYIFSVLKQGHVLNMGKKAAGPGFKIADFTLENKLTPLRYMGIHVQGV